MPKTNIATDSADELRKVIGDDATATFEDDPNFVDSNPTDNASTENIEVQRDTDDLADSEEEIEDEDAEEDDDDDLEDEDDDEDEDEDEDDDDEEEEDDADEVAASSSLRVDGVAGYDDLKLKESDEDQDDGDVDQGVDEDALDADDMDTDKVADGWPTAELRGSTLSTPLSI